MASQIPLVDYLVLEPTPHLLANECTSCKARFFDRRNACASCFGTSFDKAELTTEGEVKAFTIVQMGPRGVPVPYVAGLIDCDGTSVQANIVNCPPDPEHLSLGMKVRLTTFSIGLDEAGTDAISFGFEPSPIS
ncbi:Zn-ribbon domain-containing OB-fold protein [Jatrophihabitans sp. DSM 45814]